MSLSRKPRGGSRGVSQLEVLLLVGMIAICALAGFRAAGASFRGMATRQAACVAELESSPECVPGRRASEDGVPDRRAMIERAAGVASARRLAPLMAEMRFAPAPPRQMAFAPERFARLWGMAAPPMAEQAPRANARSFLQTVEALAGSTYAAATPAFGGTLGGPMVTASRTTPASASVAELSGGSELTDALPDVDGCFQIPGGGGESVTVTTTIGHEEVSAEVSASNVFVQSGQTFVTVSFRVSRAQVAELEADLGRHGFDVKLGVGQYVLISVTLPIDSSGRACVPSLTDPASWPSGTAVRFEVGVEVSGSGSVTVYGMNVGSSHTRSEGLVVALIKTDADHVMIVGGTTEAVSNAVWLGPSLGVVSAGIITEGEQRTDTLVVAEIELTTGSVRAGTMTVDSGGGKVSGYVQLDVGLEIEFQWTMSEHGWELSTTRYEDGEVVETHTVYDQSGRVTYSFHNGTQSELTASYLVDGGTARGFPGAPLCLDPDGNYVVQWVATPADIDALVAFVDGLYDEHGTHQGNGPMLHTNCVVSSGIPIHEVDGQFSVGGFAQVLAWCSPLELESLLLMYQDATGEQLGRIEVFDPDTGLAVTC